MEKEASCFIKEVAKTTKLASNEMGYSNKVLDLIAHMSAVDAQ